jgi:hypothetical protein
MKTGQFHSLRAVALALIGFTVASTFDAQAGNNNTLTVTETTDWATSPMELVNVSFPTLGYSGPAFAGINTIEVNAGGGNVTYEGFCVDPFHWSAGGPTPGYSEVALQNGPKSPGTLNQATAFQIEELWTEFFSPTMSSQSAAGLQVAIWELVSSNAVATGELSPKDAVTFTGNTYTAAADIASLATYHGPVATLECLTGPGQDYIVDMPAIGAGRANQAPDNGGTWIMLVLTAGALFLARGALVKKMNCADTLAKVPIRSRMGRDSSSALWKSPTVRPKNKGTGLFG